jgi:hypothetical protein
MKAQRADNAVDDVAGKVCQALGGGSGGGASRGGGRGGAEARQGRAVQLDPIKPTLKPPQIWRLKLKRE